MLLVEEEAGPSAEARPAPGMRLTGPRDEAEVSRAAILHSRPGSAPHCPSLACGAHVPHQGGYCDREYVFVVFSH